jgi:hypothetical protein
MPRRTKRAVVVAAVSPNVEPLSEVTEAFANFLTLNPKAKIVSANDPKFRAMILNPWNDESVVITIPSDYAALAKALNVIYLPDQFSAIWHADTEQLEFIFTAFPLPKVWSDVPGRSFTFRFGEIDHQCHFSASSTHLLEIVKNFNPVGSGSSGFRNLPGYALAIHAPSGVEARPLSFWIDNLKWDTDAVLNLANHLNFYLTYYDTISPSILIHNPPSTSTQRWKPQARFATGQFPTHIDGRELDEPLLILWQASRVGDNARRFLYGYRIIEYASFTYLEHKARAEVRRILAAPHAQSDINDITGQVMDALQKSKLDDYQKCEALLRETVRPELLWKEIKKNLDAFKSTTKFEGGFELGALVSGDATEASFEVRGIENFHRAIREIRNALSHGKDSRSAGVIVPTTLNFERLAPWTSLITIASGEVLLYRDFL